MSPQNPAFSDVVALLDTLVNNDPNIGDAPHGAFWRNTTRDAFIALRTDSWGVAGKLVTPPNPQTSNLFLALSGIAPFDGSEVPRMPDTDSDPAGRHATPAELAMVALWISNGCP